MTTARRAISGAVMISGVFDPANVSKTSVNDVLCLSAETISRRNVCCVNAYAGPNDNRCRRR